MARAFRIAKAKHAGSVRQMLSGAGASQYGGRWNTPGRPIIYASDSAALALLEVLVHIKRSEVVRAYKLIDLDIPDNLIQQMSETTLPRDWRVPHFNPPSTQSIGDDWFDNSTSAALQIPSVIVPNGSNYLINPTHPDFNLIRPGEIKDFPFDPRLKTHP